MSVVFDPIKVRQDFPVLQKSIHGKPLVYLDNAATTLKPQCVVERMARHYALEASNVHRGVHYLSEQATLSYECARTKIRTFIHAVHDHEVIFTRGATEGINLVAQSYGRTFLNAGDEILISHMEHHSNIVPWQMLCEEKGCVLKVIPITDEGDIDQASFEKLLNVKTKIVSLVWVSNALGTVNPVKTMIQRAHAIGAVVLIDAAQAVAHIPANVQDLDCDFLVFSGHKMFGPTGIGVLYGKEKHLDRMPPVQGGGDMISSVRFEKTTYNSLPYKFEAGTPHVAGVIGLGEAVDYLGRLGLAAISRYEHELLSYGTKAMLQVPGLRLIGQAREKGPVLSFVLEYAHAHDIGTLVDREGVAIRTGHHCAQPTMERYGVPATARASLAMYNTKAEIDILIQALLRVQELFQ